MRPATSSLPRSTRRTRFPILSFDESVLSPALGYAFDPKWVDPCESLISILWKFAQANQLSGHVVARQATLSLHADPYAGILPVHDAININALRQALHLPVKVIRGSMLDAFAHRSYCTQFRFCRKCLARGYHSTLHQLQCESECPAHQVPLQVGCRRCGYEPQCLLSARFIETPFRCDYCGAAYSYRIFSILRRTKMCKEERVAMRRRYFERSFG
jgi:hypothetical protein